MRLSARMGHWIRSQGWCQVVDGLFQQQAPKFRPWRQAIRYDLLAAKRRKATGSAGAKSSLIYATYCPSTGISSLAMSLGLNIGSADP